jgi:hypothetical protein
MALRMPRPPVVSPWYRAVRPPATPKDVRGLPDIARTGISAECLNPGANGTTLLLDTHKGGIEWLC